MKKLLFIILALISIAGIVFSGCGGGGGGEETAQIKIGAIVSMTGANAMTGADHQWAYEEAVKDINAAGGVNVGGKMMKIKLVLADDKSTAADTAAAVEKLIKLDKVDLLMGTNITPQNIAAGTVADKYQVFLSCCVSWIDQFGDQKFKWASDFFTSTSAAAEGPFQVLDTQPAAERPQKIAMMMEDNPDGQGFGDGFRANAPKYGYKIVVDEPYTPGTKDFSSSILKIKAAGCDALLWLGSPTDSIVLIRQLKEQQVNLKYIHGWKGFWPNEFYDALGKDADYIIHDGFWAETLGYPGAKELGQKYRDAHGGQDSVSCGLPYANVQILVQAIEKAGSFESAKVRDEVFGGTFKGTVMGDITYNDAGIAFTPLLGLQWLNHARMPVWPQGDYKMVWHPNWS